MKRFVPPLALLACTVIGLVAGYSYGYKIAGTLIGLGSGFIVMAILRFFTKRRKTKSKEENLPQQN